MKRTIGIAVSVALLASIFTTSPALAADPKVKPPKCTKSKAVPHDPKRVVQPTKNLKALPRTITFYTNCGNIVVETVGKKAPVTITALTTLAKAGYFDQSVVTDLQLKVYLFSSVEIQQRVQVVAQQDGRVTLMRIYQLARYSHIQRALLQWQIQDLIQMEAKFSLSSVTLLFNQITQCGAKLHLASIF